ncbi:MAG TPA: mercury methylation ferredoxin HgcB [Methanospirillum sp.]|nr:mercury methylation ferredoxin HgcB [Methanospirillum sp.]
MNRWNSYTRTTLQYNPEKCINCRLCLQVCPHQVFQQGTKKVILSLPESCMECGACQVNCPTEAITVESGVGCAYAMIRGVLNGTGEESCDCAGDGDTPSGCCG